MQVQSLTARDILRVGWAMAGFRPDPSVGAGVGDDVFSWSFDGQSVRTAARDFLCPNGQAFKEGERLRSEGSEGVWYHGSQAHAVLKKMIILNCLFIVSLWVAGDIVGCFVDLEAGVLEFTLNGAKIGAYLSGIHFIGMALNGLYVDFRNNTLFLASNMN